MNRGQRLFLNFVIERVLPEKEAEMRELINSFFKRLDAGILTKNYIAETEWQIIIRLRPECVQEFRQAARQNSRI
jgi:hypothetical protein